MAEKKTCSSCISSTEQAIRAGHRFAPLNGIEFNNKDASSRQSNKIIIFRNSGVIRMTFQGIPDSAEGNCLKVDAAKNKF